MCIIKVNVNKINENMFHNGTKSNTHIPSLNVAMVTFLTIKYRKVASSNTSRLEAHAGFFRLLMKRIFDAYVL